MTDHQVLTTKTTTLSTTMGLQTHPCSNKRPFDGLTEEPAGRQHHYLNQQPQCSSGGPRAAKQQCIRVGVEAPDHLSAHTETSPVATWYRDQTTTDYESYVSGFSAAEVRASTPTTSSYYEGAAPDYEYPSNGEAYSNVYQNLTSMLPAVAAAAAAAGGGESLADRFERVCSSPRPYVQDAGYSYGEATRTDDRYWTFGYSSHCPKKPNYNGKSGYGQQLGAQTIQRDENGKSYLELGAKAQPEWRPTWSALPPAQPIQQQQQQQQQQYVPAAAKSCTKCGHVLSQQRSLPPCYRHQRLSVLSLSMLKLNRYRQCSDPSLHRSVLICNTLRHIEDEMEREGLVCNPSTETAAAATTTTTTSPLSGSNCDTCCCSHCGIVFNNNNNNVDTSYNNTGATSGTTTTAAAYDVRTAPDPSFNSTMTMTTTATSVSTADEDDSGFGDEDSRDIDWSSVFSMSTTSGFDVSSNSSSNSSDSYLCDSNSSDPSLFATGSAEVMSELTPSWKTSNCGSSAGSPATWSNDASDFSGVRWKSELGDELEGFVHILVGS